MQSISLIDMSNLSTGLHIANNGKNLNNIVIKNCVNFDSQAFVFNWLDNKVTSNALCSLIMTNINWSNVTTAQLLKLGQIKVDGGTLSLQGKIKVVDATAETLTQIKSIFGVNVFDEHNELYIEAPVGLYMVGPSSLLMGESAQYNAYVFPSVEGTYNYHLESQSGQSGTTLSGVTIDANTGAVTSVEGITSQTPLIVVATFIATQNGDVKIGKLNFNANPRVYPTSGSIVSNDGILFDELGSHILTMAHVPSSFSGHITLNWSGSGDAYTNGNISLSNATGNQVTVNVLSIPSVQTNGTITCQVVRNYDFHVIGTYTISLSVVRTGLIMTNVSNPKVMAVCYAQGWAANSSYMTKTEAALVTSIGTVFRGTNIVSFLEFKYFTNVKTLSPEAFKNCNALKHIDLTNITCICHDAFTACYSLVELDAPNCTDLRYSSPTDTNRPYSTSIITGIGNGYALQKVNFPALTTCYLSGICNQVLTNADNVTVTIDTVVLPISTPLILNRSSSSYANVYVAVTNLQFITATTDSTDVGGQRYLSLPSNVDSILPTNLNRSSRGIHFYKCKFANDTFISNKDFRISFYKIDTLSISMPNLSSLTDCTFSLTNIPSIYLPSIDRWMSSAFIYTSYANVPSITVGATQKLQLDFSLPNLAVMHVDSNNPYYAEQSNGIVTAKDNANVYLFIPASIDTFNLTNDIIIPVFSPYIIDGETYTIDSIAYHSIKHLTVSNTNVPSSRRYYFSGLVQLLDLTISTSVGVSVGGNPKLTTVTCTVDDVSLMISNSGTVGATLDIYGGKTLWIHDDDAFNYMNYAIINVHDIQHVCGNKPMVSYIRVNTTWNFPELLDYKSTPAETVANTNLSSNNFGVFNYWENDTAIQTINCPKLVTIIAFYFGGNSSKVICNMPVLTELACNSIQQTVNPEKPFSIDITKLVTVKITGQTIQMNLDYTLNFASMTNCYGLHIQGSMKSAADKKLTVLANACTAMQKVSISGQNADSIDLVFEATSCTSITSDNFIGRLVIGQARTAIVNLPALKTYSQDYRYLVEQVGSLTQLTLTSLQSTLLLRGVVINCNIDLPAITGDLNFENCTGSITNLSAYKPSSISIAGLTNLKNIILHNLSAPSVTSTSFGSSASNYTGYTNRAAGTNALIVPSNATGFDFGVWLSPLCDTNCGGFTLQKTL